MKLKLFSATPFHLLGVLALLLASLVSLVPLSAEAEVVNWSHKGVSIISRSPEYFSADAFKQAVQKAKADGVGYITLVIPVFQSNTTSNDIGPGYQTPSDQALAGAIQYVHSLGMKVMLKPHLEAYSGDWRANINASDRNAWFTAYENMLKKYATIGKQEGVEDICIGTELISMATYSSNPDNTQRWQTMIANIRAVYDGKLTYSANWGGSDFSNEKDHIAFWSSLDYIGLSAYFPMTAASNNSVDELKKAWDAWNSSNIKPLQQKWNMPIVFTEVGYRSVTDSRKAPYDYSAGGAYDPQEQANAYEALFSYWNNYSYMQGIDVWEWIADPNAGGPGNLDYTPQNKPAEAVLKMWFSGGGATTPPPGGTTYSASAQAVGNITANNPGTIDVSVKNTSASAVSGNIVDVEIYNASNQKVYQLYFDNQSFTTNQTQTYRINWTPTTTGNYMLKVGVFNENWSTNYYWGNNVLSLTVGRGADTATSTATTTTSSTASTSIEIWWPSDGARVSGTQPFKAIVKNMNIMDYQMYWQVDGDRLNLMGDSYDGYPHKESIVDLSGWHWKGSGGYLINFVAKKLSGEVLLQKAINIYTQ